MDEAFIQIAFYFGMQFKIRFQWNFQKKQYNVRNKKNTLDGIQNKLNTSEDNISELEDIVKETIQKEASREKEQETMTRHLRYYQVA